MRYSSYKNDLTITDMEQRDDQYIVSVRRYYEGGYDWTDFVTKGYEMHQFVLKEKDGILKIVDHVHENDPFGEVLNDYMGTDKGVADANAYENAIASYQRDTKACIEKEASASAESFEQDRLALSASAFFYPYDGNSAARYAAANAVPIGWINGKPIYNDPNYYRHSVDCTNFTSRCLTMGGICYDHEGPYLWYWYSSTDKTASFTAARYFQDYYNNNAPVSQGLLAYTTINPNSLSVGDIVQILNSSGQATHSSMVIGYIGIGGQVIDWQLAMHEEDRIDWLSSMPSLRAYVKPMGCMVNF